MKNRKTETIIFEGLGFPIVLINASLRKVFGEWALNINFKKLQDVVLQSLIHKETPLTGDELRFIRKYLEMPTALFGKLFGVSHVAVVKWENNKTQINPATELCIRLFVMDHLHPKDKDFRKFYHEMSLSTLAKQKKGPRLKPLEINVDEQLIACSDKKFRKGGAASAAPPLASSLAGALLHLGIFFPLERNKSLPFWFDFSNIEIEKWFIF